MSQPSTKPSPNRLIASLTLLSSISIGLLIIRVAVTDSYRYGFLIWNLFLGFIPVLLAWWLVNRIRKYGWSKWQQIVLSLAWLVVVPNSFYIITDLIHLRANFEADLLFDAGLLVSFIIAGFMFGYISVYMLHQELLKRVTMKGSYLIVGVLFLAISFAICLGRYSRWNTWDIILRPTGLLFDVSDRFINPSIHAQTYQTTVTLFLLLFSVYIVLFEAARLLRAK